MEWCRRGESNPRPRDYETLALPLSYAGTMPNHGKESYAKVSSNTKLTAHAAKPILIAGKLELTGSPGGENPLAGQGARVYTV